MPCGKAGPPESGARTVPPKPLTRQGRWLKWVGLAVAGFALQLLVVALLLPWHSIIYEDRLYDAKMELLETHPWGAHVEEPETACDDFLFYGFGGTNCSGRQDDLETDPEFDHRVTRAEKVLHKGLLLFGAGLLLAWGSLVAAASSTTRRLVAPILLMASAAVLLAGAITYMIGQDMLAEAFEWNFELQGSDPGLYKVHNDKRIGITLGFTAIAGILVGGL